jgi:hypothetical protein
VFRHHSVDRRQDAGLVRVNVYETMRSCEIRKLNAWEVNATKGVTSVYKKEIKAPRIIVLRCCCASRVLPI